MEVVVKDPQQNFKPKFKKKKKTKNGGLDVKLDDRGTDQSILSMLVIIDM